MEKSQENLPSQNAIKYIEKQKHDLPVHKSGIELAASIINIVSSARLILRKNLHHTPSVFDINNFEKTRLALINNTPSGKQKTLEQFSLELSYPSKFELESSIEDFLYDFKMYFMNNTHNTCEENTDDEDIEYLIFEDALYDLMEPEIDMQNAYDIYMDLTDFLVSTGVQEETFEEMFELIEQENNIKYTMH